MSKLLSNEVNRPTKRKLILLNSNEVILKKPKHAFDNSDILLSLPKELWAIEISSYLDFDSKKTLRISSKFFKSILINSWKQWVPYTKLKEYPQASGCIIYDINPSFSIYCILPDNITQIDLSHLDPSDFKKILALVPHKPSLKKILISENLIDPFDEAQIQLLSKIEITVRIYSEYAARKYYSVPHYLTYTFFGIKIFSSGFISSNLVQKDINYKFPYGRLVSSFSRGTLLHCLIHDAVYEDNYAEIEFVLKNKADANIPDGEGNLPLMHACFHADIPLVQLLLKYGADPFKTQKIWLRIHHNISPYSFMKRDEANGKIELEEPFHFKGRNEILALFEKKK